MPLHSTADAARYHGVTERRIRAIARHRNVGTRVGRDWVFTDEDLPLLAPRPRGRPRQDKGPLTCDT